MYFDVNNSNGGEVQDSVVVIEVMDGCCYYCNSTLSSSSSDIDVPIFSSFTSASKCNEVIFVSL